MEDENLDKVEEPITEYARLDVNRTYTYWDYLKWQFEERVELIRGKVFRMSPAPNVSHQTINANLAFLIAKLFWDKSCMFFSAPFDVRLPVPNAQKDTTVVQPDMCIICDLEKIADNRACNGAPDLVAEIISPSNSKHDMKTKFELYEASGVKEYWIVQPEERMVLLYTLVNGKYIGLRPYSGGMTLESQLFPELKVEVSDIFHKVV